MDTLCTEITFAKKNLQGFATTIGLLFRKIYTTSIIKSVPY